MRRIVASAVGTVALVAALSAALVPARAHLSIATVGLIMVVPVVLAVVTGGYAAGLAGVAAGFLAWDFVFIPPYYTLDVGAAQNWVALAVYAAVMLLVARVVSRLQAARREAQARAYEARRLFELSQLLVEDRSLPELLESIAVAVQNVFGVAGVALLLPTGDRLEVAASVGEPPDVADLETSHPAVARPVAVGTVGSPAAPVRTVALSAAGRPIGLLALKGGPTDRSDSVLLRTFANHAALVVERAQLRAQAVRTQLLEEVDSLRRALLGSVSHDLRTPLAAMKVASSTLVRGGAGPAGSEADRADRQELYDLLDGEIDRLTRLVNGLLDLSRYQSGALELGLQECSVLDMVTEAVAGMRASLGDRDVAVDVPEDLPTVTADPVLIGQVIVNLVDNAHRHAPPGTPVTVQAEPVGDRVRLSVLDAGPGIPADQREALFEGFVSSGGGGRAGMGLWICRVFVEAHGGRLWVEEPDQGGSRFSFTLSTARRPAALLPSGR
ncbi:MAG TPA: ATP-binding protein [Acidimicrobiales bacterium]|nr:ATP-binding protein [Acidimicrobiales bacterium]